MYYAYSLTDVYEDHYSLFLFLKVITNIFEYYKNKNHIISYLS
jgi:phosphate starvation-inducible membrane PsiE